MTPAIKSGYLPVNGLNMYYEIHGAGQPLVLLHGAYMSIDSAFGALTPELAKTRQVIAFELQGHGRTADIDRPLRYESMADDVAAAMQQLGVEQADIFGYSMGAGAALQIAIRQPRVVRKLVSASGSYQSSGLYPEVLAGIDQITPEMFAGSPFEAEYQRLAPRPEDFATLVAKLTQLDREEQNWPEADIRGIKAPTLLIVGDGDVIRPEHAVEMFRLLGGGVPADLVGLPNAQLAILPGTTHVTVIDQTALLLAIVPPFLDAPTAGAS